MGKGRGAALVKRLLFVLALFVAAALREGNGAAVDQAIIWFPTGVGVAGLWLLGLRECWIIVACTAVQRLLLGYDLGVAASAGVGSAAEALLGAALLRGFDFDGALSRLRDFGVLLLAAITAPTASIAASWLGRLLIWRHPDMAFYSGWGGWWRMNALGVLAIVPPAVAWLEQRADPLSRRQKLFAALAAAAGAVGTLWMIERLPVNVTGVLMLVSTLAFSLLAGVRFGPRGAATTGAVVAIVIALSTIAGKGPFLAVARVERHTALQVFELLLVTVPLVVGVLVAERETARLRVAESEATYRALVESLPDVVMRFDHRGRFLFANENLRTMISGEPSDLLGKPPGELGAPEPQARLLAQAVTAVLESGAAFEGEVTTEGDGGIDCHNWRVVAEHDERGEVRSVVAVGRDLTARRRAEEEIRSLNEDLEARVVVRTAELTEANRELEAFSYSVSHELRAPLRAIDGYAAVLVEDYDAALDDEARGHFSALRWNAQRMGRLIDDLLAYSQAGRASLERSTVAMREEAEKAFARTVPDPQTRARIAFSIGDLPAVSGDAPMLRKVFEILLSNAVKFSSGQAQPTIAVEGALEGSEAVYRVRDNGVGFDMRYAGKLFGVFHRLHGAHEFEGTGVGLALARRIVLRHGGHVGCEGELGRGATFSFALPSLAPPRR